MNGYVLFYIAAMDDIPVGLYATMPEARKAAKLLKPGNCQIAAIAKFRNGKLVKWTVVRMFDEEDVA